MKQILFAVIVAVAVSNRASAVAFSSISYDAKSDELVVTLIYSGTNPSHAFSLQWDKCVRHPDGTNDATAQVVDSQERDAVSQDFKKTVRFSLEGLTCRPATVTLRVGPRTYTSVGVPAKH